MIQPTDFIMDHVETKWFWFMDDCIGIPLMRWPDGALCDPFVRYFANGWRTRLFKAKTSMKPDSYSIRQWFCFLTNLGRHWFEGDDDLLSAFRVSFAKAIKDHEISTAQVEEKLGHVFKFYRHIGAAMPFLESGRLTPRFVGGPGEILTPFTSRLVKTKKKSTSLIWSRAGSRIRAKTKRPTPNDQEVQRILDYLRFRIRKEQLQKSEGWKEELRLLEGERNWLIARCEAEAGLRRGEVENLSVWQFAASLVREKLLPLRTTKKSAEAFVMKAGLDAKTRDEILDNINRYCARGYQTLYVTVVGKRGERSVAFPIELVRDILEICIWTGRRRMVEHWTSERPGYAVDGSIFLSGKSKVGLTAGAIGDIVNDAFSDLNIAGSGHRLRAHYMTNMAWLLWNENFALGGYRFDNAVVNLTLDRLAELGGHKNPTLTEQYYVDMALLRHNSKVNRPRMNAVSDAWNTFIYTVPLMDEHTVRLLEKTAHLLADKEQAVFREILMAMLRDFESQPANPTSKTTSAHLRLVAPEGRPPNT